MNAFEPDLKQFIREYIDSAQSLDVLLLLRRSPDAFWGAPAIAERLRLPLEFVVERLNDLHSRGLIRRGAETGAFRFSPGDDRTAEVIDRLASIYEKRRGDVIEAIGISY